MSSHQYKKLRADVDALRLYLNAHKPDQHVYTFLNSLLNVIVDHAYLSQAQDVNEKGSRSPPLTFNID
jgi:hypothetical protein